MDQLGEVGLVYRPHGVTVNLVAGQYNLYLTCLAIRRDVHLSAGDSELQWFTRLSV